MKRILLRLTKFSDSNRRFILILSDIIIINLSFLFISYLGKPFDLYYPYDNNLNFYFVLTFCSLIINFPNGYYKGILRYYASQIIFEIAIRNLLFLLLVFLMGNLFNLYSYLVQEWILLFLTITTSLVSFKFLVRNLLINFLKSNKYSKKVVIYGAGSAGAQLASSLRFSSRQIVKYFIDDNPNLWERTIYDIPIKPPYFLKNSKNKFDQLLIAIPSLNIRKQKKILDGLETNGMEVLRVPSIDEITSGKAKIDNVRPFGIEDLLGREPVYPREHLLKASITNNVVFVSGAGGSIGSELSKQIVKLSPKALLLFESNELSLWKIEKEIKNIATKEISIIPILGDAKNFSVIKDIFIKEKVDIVFHAAAYKHVPLVEANPLEGLANNVFSTRSICKAAKDSFVQNVVLISTDKAVRPTSVMGASKRLAELVVQAYANCEENFSEQSKAIKTIFSIVRFGNVLGSSGSVIPLFRSQISVGGPVTLTHDDVIRYFMTIKEASQLVIQASALGKGGDVFLLDMGEPIKIKELAKKMIRLSGLTIKDKSNQDGDIEIITTGLRPGEKLYEETLIEGDFETTEHPLIYRGIENFIKPSLLWDYLEEIEKDIISLNKKAVFNKLKIIIPEWKQFTEKDSN